MLLFRQNQGSSKNFQKDFVPATISSWIKQTVLLCYQLSDQEAQDLRQVRALDVRAFQDSKAFQGGVSLDQILSACHWKAHNTFTQFYLKDLAWAESELYHLGPVYILYIVYKKKQKKTNYPLLLDCHDPSILFLFFCIT